MYKFITAVSAMVLAFAPAAASAANPAASLSVAPTSARSSASNDGASKLNGGVFPVLALGAIFVAAILLTKNDSDSPDSP